MNELEASLNLPGIIRQIHFQFDPKDIEASQDRIRLCLEEFGVTVDRVATEVAQVTESGEVVLAITDKGYRFHFYMGCWICGDDQGWYIFGFKDGQMYEFGPKGVKKEIKNIPTCLN
jgi:hypothetical protein